MTGRPDGPAPSQLRYLRALAERTGTTFTNPHTRADASREIHRLEALPSLARGERQGDRRAFDEDRERLQPSSTVRPEEVEGYGSRASWAERA
jgi:hypothetical protein